ncbi:MAG: dephospho-CoA kinase [Paludibacteraceae bacterium]|nr:dephospho-CoA kinase [Paludibacteraceae bacterium]
MIIGVTGGIGSGKSTVLRAVARQGYRVYDCDREAKRIILEDDRVRKQMIALFGEEVYKDGVYQTSLVAAEVFANPDKLQQLNAIVHPAVAEDISNQQTAISNQIYCLWSRLYWCHRGWQSCAMPWFSSLRPKRNA